MDDGEFGPVAFLRIVVVLFEKKKGLLSEVAMSV
jgi:hypothetical protein